jgi:hypothetical protein
MTAHNKKCVNFRSMKSIADHDQSCAQRLFPLHVTARNHDCGHEDCRDVQHADTQPAYPL